jgi:hypothetical protein
MKPPVLISNLSIKCLCVTPQCCVVWYSTDAGGRIQAGQEYSIMAKKLVNDWSKLEITMSTVMKLVSVKRERERERGCVCAFVCVSV